MMGQNPRWDMIVVGSGPAGSSAARVAADAGLKVLLLEKDASPGQTNVCAGGIPPSLAEELSLKEEFIEKRVFGGIHYFPWGKAEIRRRKPIHICVDRQRFDALLASMAHASGARLETNTRAIDISFDNDLVKVIADRGGSRKSFSSRIVILADGVNTLARKKLGVGFRRDRNTTAVSYACEFQVPDKAPSLDMLELFYDPSISPFGYGWVFPKRTTINVGLGVLLSRIESPFAEYRKALMEHPRIAYLIEGGKKVWHGSALIPARPADRIYHGRALVVGDAAGFVHALWGAGNHHAVLSGQLAARAAVESISDDDDLRAGSKYEELWRRTESCHEIRKAWKICRIVQDLESVDPYSFPKFIHALLLGKLATLASPRIFLYPFLQSQSI